MNDSVDATFRQLKPAQKILGVVFIALFIGPPILVAEFNLPPAAWLNSQQAQILNGSYLPKLTVVLLMLANALILLLLTFAIALPVKWLTGKTVVQLFSKKTVPEGPVPLTNICYQSGETLAEIYVLQEWIDERKTVSIAFPDGSQFQIKLAPPMSGGSQCRLKSVNDTGPLRLTIRV